MLCSIGAIQKPYEAHNMGQVNNLSVSPAQGFNDVLKAATGTNAVISEIEALGVNVTVRAVPNNPETMRSHANTISSFGNVTIAPNILEEMANDSETRQKYVTKIESWLIRGEEHAARVSAMGGRSVHRSMVIHEDGSVTYNSMTVCDPADDDDDDTCEAVKTENVNFYEKLDYEGAGQHLVIENMPLDRFDSKMASSVMSDSLIRQYQQLLK